MNSKHVSTPCIQTEELEAKMRNAKKSKSHPRLFPAHDRGDASEITVSVISFTVKARVVASNDEKETPTTATSSRITTQQIHWK